MISYKLYAITDRSWLTDGETMADAVKQAILGGATFIQLREKNMQGEELELLARSVQEVCRTFRIPFVINDNVPLAQKIDADGVHLGQSDMAIAEARKLLGPNKIIGATAKTIQQARLAYEQGADYLGSGAIFGTTTKKDAKPMTLDLLNEICASVPIPVVAIGGINAENVSKLRGAKIAGVAVVSGIFEPKNKRIAAKEILANLYGRPLIQCITNHVTINQVANMILANQGSPIMAHHPLEVEDVQTQAAGLLLNLGATDDYEAMKPAYKKALELNHITVIDPVGISGIKFRRDFMMELLAIGSPTCIRANYAEIRAIYENQNTSVGLDCSETADETIVTHLARKLGCMIIATGEIDYISDGNITVRVCSGHPMQKALTGSGCMLSAALCTELAFNQMTQTSSLPEIAKRVCTHIGDAANYAAQKTIAEGKGILSFQSSWFDALNKMN